MKEKKAQWLYQQPEKYKQKNPTRYVKALETLGKTEDLRSWSDYLGTNYAQAVGAQEDKLKGFKRQLASATPSMNQERRGFKQFVGKQYDPRTGQDMTAQLYGTRQQSLADVIGAEQNRLTADALTKETEANVGAAAYERALQEDALKQQSLMDAYTRAATEAQLTGYYTAPALGHDDARARAFTDIETQLGRKINPEEAGLVEDKIKSYTTPSTTPTLDYLTAMAAMNKSSGSGYGKEAKDGDVISPGMLALAQKYLDGDPSFDMSNLSYDLQGEFWNAVASLQTTGDTIQLGPTIDQPSPTAQQYGEAFGETIGGIPSYLAEALGYSYDSNLGFWQGLLGKK